MRVESTARAPRRRGKAEPAVHVDEWVTAVKHCTDEIAARELLAPVIERYASYLGECMFEPWAPEDRRPELQWWRNVPGCPEWCGEGHRMHYYDAKEGTPGAFPVLAWVHPW